MQFDDLCEDAQKYIDRYIRGHDKTREEAMREILIQEIIKEYEKGD